MPLLRRKPFERIKPPADLRADEEVFHCTLTNEIFRDYEQFYERIILCNSLVWSCALTGRPNLTYAEAKESEKSAKDLMQQFPKELHVPTLYIASLAQRTSFLDVVEDVYIFTKDRFFVGEQLEAILEDGAKTSGNLTDPALYQYEVISPDKEWQGKKLVSGSELRRPKSHFSREKQKIFLRGHTESGSGGIIKLKEYALRKYRLHSVSFSSIFAGPEPNFQQSKRALKVLGLQQLSQEEKERNRKEKRNLQRKEKRMKLKEAKMLAEQQQNSQTTPRKRNSESGRSPQKSPKSASKVSKASKKEVVKKLTPEQLKELNLEKARKQKEAEKQRKLEERAKARVKAKEEKKRLEEYYKEWSKPRDDLLCEDLRDLPQACMVQCRIPNHLFGDFVAVLEFLTSFRDILNVQNFFPKGMTFELLERAVVEKELAGPMSDLLQLLLHNIFTMQEEEEAEVTATDRDAKVELSIGESGSSVTLQEAIREATKAASWSQHFHGCSLNKLSLDSTTLSEVLRLHLYSSGGRSNDANSAWRYQQRGGYTLYDDPGLMLRMSDPQIFRALKYKTVIELSIEEKLKIITCLMHQILMFASVRDIVFERTEKLKKLKTELRTLQAAEKRRELEELEAEKAKREKESNRKRAEFLTKEHKLQAEVANLEWGVAATPLGLDRAYRRYWMFQSLPGIFVEHDDDFVGPCIEQGTPTNRVQLCDDPLEYVRHLFVAQQHGRGGSEEASSGSSDKENDRSPHTSAVKQKPATLPAPLPRIQDNQDSCPVHSTVLPRVRWAFYNHTEELDGLLASLNQRGYREGELKQALVTLRASIETSMARCPAHLLGRPEDEEKVEVVETTRRSARQTASAKSQADAYLNFDPDTPLNKILGTTLCEMILDLEEKIHLGGLGTLKVENREAWRESIEREEYDSQCEKLYWGGSQNQQNEGFVPTDKILNRLKSEGRAASRPDTPDSLESGPTFQDPLGGEGSEEDELIATVHSYACALLQLEQALETRYLKEPLAGEEVEDDKEKAKKSQRSQLERWEQSLMASTSFSQLFVHYHTLDGSVTWSKSALNARCKLCRRKGDGENMLLCDGCNKGHHIYCLKPVLKRDGTSKHKSVPLGEWFCGTCRPKEVPPTPRKNRRNFTEEEESEESESDDDEEEEDGEEASDNDEANSSEEQNESMEVEEEEEEEEICASCKETGDMVKCEVCSCAFHPECAKPKLRVVPRTAWTCQDCRDKAATKGRGAKRHGALVLAQKSVSSRRSAREASNKITKAAKRLRSNSWDDTDSSRATSVTDEPSSRRSSNSTREQRVRRRPRWAGQKLHKFFERKCQELNLKLQEEELESPDIKRPRRLI
ncbi:hypothetical protein B566_EDAN015151 [Ephemera danica]|nr:hypothetical protein B566_EDAN015151 [Ephemera danica]